MDRDHEDAEAYQDPTREVPLVCADGDRSSLVAAMSTISDPRATDVIGVNRLAAAGLPAIREDG